MRSALLVLTLVAWSSGPAACLASPEDIGPNFFEKQILPVLTQHCVSCHGPDQQEGGLRLDSRQAILSGGGRGPAIVPGKPAESLLLEAIDCQHELRMPPDAQLEEAQIAAFATWVRDGAEWPEDLQPEAASTLLAEEEAFFEKHIRPVLAENCYSCHGVKKQESGLRVDSRAGLLEGGYSGPAMVPGDASGSLLMEYVRHGGDIKMPPDRKLLEAQIEALAAWIDRGAGWPRDPVVSQTGAIKAPTVAEARARHWAFQGVRKPALPAVKDQNWSQTPIDRFVLHQLESLGMVPSKPADKRTLLRRVYFDLVGLPPTPEEIETFLADSSDDAYAKVVERLLASPHYGERWARHWLDVARYADTKGLTFGTEEFRLPFAYTYRDYVIRAFNEDRPYDQFVREQIAADQLPLGGDLWAQTATGFLTVGNSFRSNTQDILDDRIDVVTSGFLGLTVSCARCHDHKFDPIPTRDYYSLYGVLASSVVPLVPPLLVDPAAVPEHQQALAEIQSRQKKADDHLNAQYEQLIAGAKDRAAEYLLRAYTLRNQPPTGTFVLLTTDPKELNPRMVFRWQIYLASTRKTAHPVFIPWHRFSELAPEEFSSEAAEVTQQLQQELREGAVINPLVVKSFAEQLPSSMQQVAERYSTLLNGAQCVWQESLAQAKGRGEVAPDALADSAQEQLRQVYLEPDSPPNIPLELLEDFVLFPYPQDLTAYIELRKAVEKLMADSAADLPRAMALADVKPAYDPRVFQRGNPNNLGPAVPRQFLEILAGESRRPFQVGSGRLELAEAIASAENPLTSRVFVNRVWLHHFGAGLVRTPSDFGLRGEPPTHPDLLDWLAATFVEQGWSVKDLHRLILLSATYKQASDDRADAHALDPENKQLWRMNRTRLEFEAMRDSMLMVSGSLDPTVGGPSVPHILGTGLRRTIWDYLVSASLGRRRTLYGYLDRDNVPGLYRTFDFPSPDATSPQRGYTNVPQQALFLLNSPFVIEQARRLVVRPDVAALKTPELRIERLYRLAFGRGAEPDEVAAALEFLTAAAATASDAPAEKSSGLGTEQVVSLLMRPGVSSLSGLLPASGAITAEPPLSPWEQFAQMLLVSNEFMFVD